MNGHEHAHEAERLTKWANAESANNSEEWYGNAMAAAQVHATLAVAYAQAGAWADIPSPDDNVLVVHPLHPDDPRNKVTTHVRESTDQGPDYCKPCSDAIGEWVPWPCAGSLSSEPCRTYGCVRAQGHDGNHVAANGIDWPDA